MATRPSEKPAWVPSNDPAKIVAPSASKKNTGWLQEEKPPFQYFNWFWNLLDQWLDYLGGYIRYNVVIDSVAAEADFSSLAAYLAGAPAAGDRVLVKVDEVLTATLSIPAGVEVTFLKEKKLSTITVFTPVIQLGDRSALVGDCKLETSHTGTIAKAVSINGDGTRIDNLTIENTTTGIVTDAVYIEASKEFNVGQIAVTNTGAGSITSAITDASTKDNNDIDLRTDSTIIRLLESLPIGSEVFWPSATPPTNWMEEDGSAISRTTYDTLFAQISTDYGVGDGSTTFNLPDPRGRAVRVWDHAAGVDPDAAGRTDRGDGTTGDNVGTNQADEVEAHVHAGGVVVGTTITSAAGFILQQGDTSSYGGSTETRMINTNRMMIMKVA